MERRRVLTLRLPKELVQDIREVKAPDESLNDFLCAVAEKEVTRRRALALHERIVQNREAIRARTGTHPDVTPWIREMREGNPRDG